jgi:hypothetical protein
MKSVVSNQKCSNLPYPKLMVATSNSNLVILFQDSRTGTVVSSGNSSYTLGQHRHDIQNNLFEEFKGSVCLENNK